MLEEENTKKLKYYKLMEELKEQIVSGKLRAGDKLPSENELSRAYGVSRQTVRKALLILENAGYIYAEHGRGTFCSELVRHTRTSKNIAVVTTYLSDYIFPRVIQGIDQCDDGSGVQHSVKEHQKFQKTGSEMPRGTVEKRHRRAESSNRVRARSTGRHMNLYQKLDEFQIPYVFIQGCFRQMEDKPQILMDDCKGGYLITKYLIGLGHREILGVFKADDTQGQNRHKGYVRALQEAGLSYDPVIMSCGFTRKTGRSIPMSVSGRWQKRESRWTRWSATMTRSRWK